MRHVWIVALTGLLAAAPARAEAPPEILSPFDARLIESLVSPRALLGEVVTERDLDLLLAHVRAALLAAAAGTQRRPPPTSSTAAPRRSARRCRPGARSPRSCCSMRSRRMPASACASCSGRKLNLPRQLTALPARSSPGPSGVAAAALPAA